VDRPFWISRKVITREMTGSWPERAEWDNQPPWWQMRFAKWLTQNYGGEFRVARWEEVLLANEYNLTSDRPERKWSNSYGRAMGNTGLWSTRRADLGVARASAGELGGNGAHRIRGLPPRLDPP